MKDEERFLVEESKLINYNYKVWHELQLRINIGMLMESHLLLCLSYLNIIKI